MMCFSQDIVQHYPVLRRYAKTLRKKRPASAEDLVQETMLKAWHHQTKFQAGTNLQSWLCTLMHNINVSQIRLLESQAEHVETYDCGVLPEQEIILYVRRDVMNAIGKLPEVMQISLNDLALGRTEFECAERRGISLAAIKSLNHRSRMALREFLDGRKTPWRTSRIAAKQASWWTDECIATMNEMRAAGKTYESIGTELGCSEGAVRAKLRYLKFLESGNAAPNGKIARRKRK